LVDAATGLDLGVRSVYRCVFLGRRGQVPYSRLVEGIEAAQAECAYIVGLLIDQARERLVGMMELPRQAFPHRLRQRASTDLPLR
jgi:hypothetical protein